MRLLINNNNSVQSLNLGLSGDFFKTSNPSVHNDEILSCWPDNYALAKDYKNMIDYYKFSSRVIFNIMNSRNDIDESFEYCHMLTAPWALTFSMIILEKYQTIFSAIGDDSISFEKEITEFDFILQKSGDLFRYSQSDKFNKSLIIDILLSIQKFRLKKTKKLVKCSLIDEILFEPPQLKPGRSVKRIFFVKVLDYFLHKLKLVIEFLMNTRSNKNKVTLFLLPEISLIDIIKIYLKQKTSFKIMHSIKVPNLNSSKSSRIINSDALDVINDELSFVLQELVSKNIPQEFLEDFNDYQKYANEFLNDELLKVVVRSPTDTNPVTRHILALSNKFNIDIVGLQHGGGFNNYENHPLDQLENDLTDYYLVWGDISLNNSRKVGYTRTSEISLYSKNYYRNSGPILIVSPPLRRYYAGDFSHAISFTPNYMQNMHKFLEFLEASLYSKIIYRRGWDFGINEEDWIQSISSEITISSREKISHAYQDVAKSSIVICTYNSTMWLELSRINHPFILFLDSRYDLKTSLNEEIFSMMEKNSLLFYEPFEAANHIMSCFNDPRGWWNSSNVQSVRVKINDAFCSQFDPSEVANILNT